MADPHAYTDTGLESPAKHVVLIDISSTDHALDPPCRGLSFATAGALKIDTVGGETVTIPNGALAAGIIHGIRASKVYKTGTAAASIVAYY